MPGGFNKELKISPELQAIVKQKKMSRGQVTKALWKYINKHDLKSEKDGRIIRCNSKMQEVFKKTIRKDRKLKVRGNTIKVPAGSIFMTEIAGALSAHLG